MKKIGFVGAGNMAGALIRGLLRAGHHDAGDIRASDPAGGQARVVRVMPNTPALVGRGISVAVAGAKATPADLKHALKLFKAVGEAVAITGEDLLDAVTALSGSGPAFVYLFAECLIEGGVRGGLPQNLAAQL